MNGIKALGNALRNPDMTIDSSPSAIKKLHARLTLDSDFDESKHPREADGKFGDGGGHSVESAPEKKQSQANEVRPQSEMPKPNVTKVMGQKFIESMLYDMDAYKYIENSDPYKQEAMSDIKRSLKRNGIEYIDAYHVTDMTSSSNGIHGSEVDPMGSYGENVRGRAVYVFLDPDDIKKGYYGILGAKGDDNTVMHIRIPIDKVGEMKGDGLFNMTFGTYSAVGVEGDIPAEWIDGMYKYKQPD